VSLGPFDMEFLRQLVSRHTGVTMDQDSAILAEVRLDAVARHEGLTGALDVLRLLRAGPPDGLERRAVEALLNSETFFFRDLAPFEALREILPAALARAAPGQTVNVWSAACSSGQEPYSVAIVARESLCDRLSRLRIIASDFSRHALARAREARYSQIEVNRGLPAACLVKYFDKAGPDWRLQEAIRTMVDFREINLMGGLDVPLCDAILLRNVLIYLPLEKRRDVLVRVRARLKPGGVLLLGTSETTLGVDDGFDILPMGGVTGFRARETRRRVPATLGDAAVEDVVRTIWSLTLGLTIALKKGAPPSATDVAATVRLTGAWKGGITLRCSAGMARRAAAAMFRVSEAQVTDADLRDAVGELANIAAGNLRSYLPGPTALSLPRAENGEGGAELCRTSFVCEGAAFELRIASA
jgi:chemotaxis protein methyltransferase CheR